MQEDLFSFLPIYGGVIIISNLLIWAHVFIPKKYRCKLNLIDERYQCRFYSFLTIIPMAQLTILAMSATSIIFNVMNFLIKKL